MTNLKTVTQYIFLKWQCLFSLVCVFVGFLIPVHHHNKTDRHDLTEILWKVALNTLTICITDKTFTGFDNEYHSGECLIKGGEA
jgi:hypothetical protein